MAECRETSSQEKNEDKSYPAVAMYGPKNVRDLKEGDVKFWCVCGLSKKQPWCDGSHKGTGHVPLKWTVPNTQSIQHICLCKHTGNPPFCDGTHTNLPTVVQERVEKCQKRMEHNPECRLCTGCGWIPDF